jgi:tRNA pseudouridine13 synthase
LLTFQGYADEPIGLNSHEGNSFKIVVRGLRRPLNKIKYFCSYYDSQRFGSIRPITSKVGKLLVQRNYEEAMRVYLTRPFPEETDDHKDFRNEIEKYWGDFDSRDVPGYLLERKVVQHLERNPKKYLDAFRELPKQIFTLFIHAYQSEIFNKILNEYVIANHNHFNIDNCLGKLAMNTDNLKLKIPLIGYDFENKDKKIKDIVTKILKEENLKLDSFKFKEVPFLSSRTIYRNASAEIKKLKLANMKGDDMNSRRRKQEVSFTLDPGTYATLAVRAMGDTQK